MISSAFPQAPNYKSTVSIPTPAQKIIFDCDPGVDDALALSLIMSCHSQAKLLGVTTVCGNTSVENGTNNALALLESAGFPHIPVAQGCANFSDHAFNGGVPHIHGVSGSGEIELKSSTSSAALDAADFIIKTVREHPHELDIIAVGPLANLAEVLKRDPEIPSLVRHLHIMGGAFWRQGNVSEHGEANIHNDVQAAAAVFAQSWGGFITPLDATIETYFTETNLNQLKQADSKHAQLLGQIADFYCHFYKSCTGTFGCSLHDPLAVAAALGLVHPKKLKFGQVTVDTDAEHYGRTRLWDTEGVEISLPHSSTEQLPPDQRPRDLQTRGSWAVISHPVHEFPQILADQICQLP